ncbi:MAG: imidazoleglycerol-phosphate dehydratase, partial [Bacillota bacterium]|nr:imidazoleglycerol-phosphate dehydratase [Bacillota bacterium]
MERTASVERKTNETNIKLQLSIDGEGQSNIQTGVP